MKTRYKTELLKQIFLGKKFGDLPAIAFKMLAAGVCGPKRLIFGLRVQKPKPAEVMEIPDFKVRLFSSWDTVDDTVRSELKKYKDYISANVENLIKKGAWLWAGQLDGKLTNIALTRTGDTVERYFFPLTSECVLISHCVTIPEYRRLGIYKASLVEIIDKLGENGAKMLYIDCNDWNTASIRAIELAGFELIGEGKDKGKQLIWRQKTRPDFTAHFNLKCSASD